MAIILAIIHLHNNVVCTDIALSFRARTYAKEIPLNITKNYVLLYTKVIIEEMRDYSYVLMIFMGEGVYVYGYAFIKDPTYGDPIVYGINGTQNDWFLMGNLVLNKTYHVILLIDKEDNTVHYRINETTAIKRCQKIHNISRYMVIADSIDEEIPLPRISIKRIIISQTDSIPSDLMSKDLYTILDYIINNTEILYDYNYEYLQVGKNTTSTTMATTMQTTTLLNETDTHTEQYSKTYKTDFTIFLALIIASIVLAVMLVYYRKRSHGP